MWDDEGIGYTTICQGCGKVFLGLSLVPMVCTAPRLVIRTGFAVFSGWPGVLSLVDRDRAPFILLHRSPGPLSSEKVDDLDAFAFLDADLGWRVS